MQNLKKGIENYKVMFQYLEIESHVINCRDFWWNNTTVVALQINSGVSIYPFSWLRGECCVCSLKQSTHF